MRNKMKNKRKTNKSKNKEFYLPSIRADVFPIFAQLHLPDLMLFIQNYLPLNITKYRFKAKQF